MVNGLAKIPSLLPQSGMSLIESYQWNQTVRLKDLAMTPVDHLMVFWERWTSILGDSADEIKRIAKGEEGLSDDDVSMESDEDELWQRDMIRKMTPTERAMATECGQLVKLSRSLMRKVRSKCINVLRCETQQEIQLIDDLFTAGQLITDEVDSLATALFPVQDSFAVREMAIRLAKVAQSLSDLVKMYSAEPTNQTWFDNCSHQCDKLIIPVIERSPFR